MKWELFLLICHCVQQWQRSLIVASCRRDAHLEPRHVARSGWESGGPREWVKTIRKNGAPLSLSAGARQANFFGSLFPSSFLPAPVILPLVGLVEDTCRQLVQLLPAEPAIARASALIYEFAIVESDIVVLRARFSSFAIVSHV